MIDSLRKPLIAGNWKMFHGGLSGLKLATECASIAKRSPDIEIVIAPPFTALAAAASSIEDSGLEIAGQNLYPGEKGAFTGEICGQMLKEAGCTWVIVGHSERRGLFHETDEMVHTKIDAAFAAGLRPIACVGETLAEREAGKTLEVVERQVLAFLKRFDQELKDGISAAIAYEPVWAIGTGKVAGPHEAEEVHAAVRDWMASLSPALAAQTRLLYGGSVKPENAADLLACPNIDGALIGGASLDAASFGAIASAAERLVATSAKKH
ncbi:MAG: triose-phosphate isomerase [Polyangiaceae bacterium]